MLRLNLSMIVVTLLLTSVGAALEPIPDKLVVLTFDDSAKSHYTIVRPILKRFGFGATFFITEGFDFRDNKTDYMTWTEIQQLHRDGFEIGNHTRDHLGVTDQTVARLPEQLAGIAEQCQRHDIPQPISFAYPGNATTSQAFEILNQHGIRFARRGGLPEFPYDRGRGVAYEPGLDHPLLIPSAGDARPDWELADFIQAVQQARHGRIAVLQFHGVPETAHAWVNTPRDKFETYMHYLATNQYHVIALRDLAKYVDTTIVPQDPQEVIQDRQRQLAAGRTRDNFRTPASDEELREWLRNMAHDHGFSIAEMCRATGLTSAAVAQALERFNLNVPPTFGRRSSEPLRVVPYPGGRHPRIGFLDGAIRPQRESKFSVFAPWADGGYVVADIPEAIWMATRDGRELLYLAHTHVPTVWTKQGIELPQLEWTRQPDGVLQIQRPLPNQVSFGAKIVPQPDGVLMELWLANNSPQILTGLHVQNCVMLKAASGFATRTTENKLFQAPYAACHDQHAGRWIITAWEHCVRPWGNQHCPCLHSDPQFPDCPPGETQRLRGWISFYEGTDIQAELKRLDQLDWLNRPLP